MAYETEVETDNLVTVNHFARMCDLTPSFMYILQKSGQIKFIMIDGVAFIDKQQYESFADSKNTKKVIAKLKLLIQTKKSGQKHNITTKPSV